jgi:integrase
VRVKENRGWLLIAGIPLGDRPLDQYLGLKATRDNWREARRTCKALAVGQRSGALEQAFVKRFPESRFAEQARAKQTEGLALAIFARAWLDERKATLTKSTHYDYDCLIRAHLDESPLGAMLLAEIDDGHISRFISDLAASTKRVTKAQQKAGRDSGDPISARRVNMVIARLRTIFATAYRRKLVANDPMRHVANLREPKPEVDPFDLDEARRLIDAAQGWERAFITTLLFTGMRPGEALALSWGAMDWDRGLILIRRTVSRRYGFGLPKTKGSEREVEMIAPVRDALREQRARSQLRGDLVFPSEQGTAIDLANFRARNWPRILTRAKLRPRNLYQCRHTFARLAIEHGDTPQHVAAQLGHTSVEMVFRVYARWTVKPASALEKLERAITRVSPKNGGEMAGSDGN